MDKKELQQRLKNVARELASIENDDENLILTIEEDSQICDMRRKLRRMIERLEKGDDSMKVNVNGQEVEVKKWNYGNYSSDNYGAHSIAIEIGRRTVYFSFDTPIAFSGYNSKGEKFYCVRQNEWGGTTGKHLNWIDRDKSIRLPSEEFEKELARFLE